MREHCCYSTSLLVGFSSFAFVLKKRLTITTTKQVGNRKRDEKYKAFMGVCVMKGRRVDPP